MTEPLIFKHKGYTLRLRLYRGKYNIEAENTGQAGPRKIKRWSLKTANPDEARGEFYRKKHELESKGYLSEAFESSLVAWLDTFAEWSRINSKAKDTYRRHLDSIMRWKAFISDESVEILAPEVYERFKAYYLDRGLSKRTVDIHLTAAGKMITVLEDMKAIPRGSISRPKLIRAKLTKAPKFWTEKEVAEILEAARSSWIYGPLVLALNTGLRLNEILHLRWEDINLEGGYLLVQGYRILHGGEVISFEPKDHEIRRIKLNEPALSALVGAPKRGPLVFCKDDGFPPSKENTYKTLKGFIKKLGLQDKGVWHAARRTWGSHALMNGADVRSVQLIYGHSDLKTTQAYLNVTAQHLDDTVDLVKFGGFTDPTKVVLPFKKK